MKLLGGHISSAALLLLVLQVFSPVHAQYRGGGRQSDCTTHRSTPGECVAISMCSELLQLLMNRKPENFNILRASQCGFSDLIPKVCCPIVTTSTRPSGNNYNSGTTGDNSSNQPPSGDQTWNLSSNTNLPTTCGEGLDNLALPTVGVQRTNLYEFPWMALLEYTKPNGRMTACGGVLISKRYVLTTAHCIKGKDLPTTWKLVSVRFGEYDTSTERDCFFDSATSTFCVDDPVNVGVEQQIAHEDYDPQSRHQANDIALLRLARDVAFTDYIRPICLPSSAQASQNFFFVAGWGKTETRSESNVKLKLRVPLADSTTCANTYQSTAIQLGEGQLCAGGQQDRDVCRGDSGGPLMAFKTTNEGTIQWTVYGIVSFGPSPCGMRNWPRVYTKITKYVPWILSKIRA